MRPNFAARLKLSQREYIEATGPAAVTDEISRHEYITATLASEYQIKHRETHKKTFFSNFGIPGGISARM